MCSLEVAPVILLWSNTRDWRACSLHSSFEIRPEGGHTRRHRKGGVAAVVCSKRNTLLSGEQFMLPLSMPNDSADCFVLSVVCIVLCTVHHYIQLHSWKYRSTNRIGTGGHVSVFRLLKLFHVRYFATRVYIPMSVCKAQALCITTRCGTHKIL